MQPTMYGIRYVDPETNEMKLAEIYSTSLEGARKVFSSLGPKHKEDFDVLDLEDYKELLQKQGYDIKEGV
jgi:hypothetical protein